MGGKRLSEYRNHPHDVHCVFPFVFILLPYLTDTGILLRFSYDS